GGGGAAPPRAAPEAGRPLAGPPPPARAPPAAPEPASLPAAGMPPTPDPLDERRRRAQKLELFGRLASGIIHDFNNLLTIVLGYCDIPKANLPAHHPLRVFVD